MSKHRMCTESDRIDAYNMHPHHLTTPCGETTPPNTTPHHTTTTTTTTHPQSQYHHPSFAHRSLFKSPRTSKGPFHLLVRPPLEIAQPPCLCACMVDVDDASLCRSLISYTARPDTYRTIPLPLFYRALFTFCFLKSNFVSLSISSLASLSQANDVSATCPHQSFAP